MQVKDMGRIVRKWIDRASVATEDYKDGIMNPSRSWKDSTLAAEAAFEAGINAAVARKAFGKGVAKRSDEDWKSKASTKGANRYAEGVRLSEGDFSRGIAPYLQVLKGLTLPPRGARGSPDNYRRAQAVGEALHKARVGG